METIVSASILSADMCNLGADLTRSEKAGVDYIHFDVMDGVFVNNISYGIPVLKAVRGYTDMFLDVHLMITEPYRFIKTFADNGADMITFHAEAESDIGKTVRLIHSLGKKAGLAIKPHTSEEAVYEYINDIDMVLVMTVEPGFGGQGFIEATRDKIRAIRRFADEKGIALDIEVDGGINEHTVPLVRADGANVLVAGSYLYEAPDMSEAVRVMKEQKALI